MQHIDKCRLLIDNRERKVYEGHLDRLAVVDYELLNLPTGDYIVTSSDNRPVAIIERKTYPDFAASLSDGRMSNREKMYAFREKFSCQVILLIEGEANPRHETVGGVGYANIRACIDHMMLRDDVHVVYTARGGDSSLDTVQWLLTYCANVGKVLAGGKAEDKAFAERVAVRPRMEGVDLIMPSTTLEEMVLVVWRGQKGVGPVKARRLMGQISLAEYIDKGEMSITGLCVLLARIKGLGKERAARIVEYAVVKKRFYQELSAEELGGIIHNGRRLGDKLGQKICSVLKYKKIQQDPAKFREK